MVKQDNGENKLLTEWAVPVIWGSAWLIQHLFFLNFVWIKNSYHKA
jgi:hypothetical protein